MNIMAIGAHHDDIELGVGGTLAKFAKEKNKVYGLTLTDSETYDHIKKYHRPSQRAVTEHTKAAKIIGYEIIEVPKELLGICTKLHYSPELMQFIETTIHKYKIDILFVHWKYDMNTDHEEAAKLSILAGRHAKRVLMYRSNWYQPDKGFNGIVYSDISEVIAVKKKALNSYTGEIRRYGKAWINSFIDANRSWGYSIGSHYAEVFEPVRYIL
ncbi:MAG: hypothetical protein A2606_03645 [Candidatus Yanofskybacteria bacterium RIFOXYD1_FULL_42_10]|uniref:LmbE family protein n=1 Tax=Candidatus Yanofskybacteria bacterium RIFOXYD1_FULL_42_10 TaxID=1802718 RepID=A0A1F8HTN6_9BACT|nr:MAG: hypothetical protein A2606_03645 [Candidatus Yanofskybacteria bacterium RIFOXYD1_FULL_42_10]